MIYDKRRWVGTRDTIEVWISNLDIKKLALITYNDEATVRTKGYLDVETKQVGDSNDNLKNIIDYLKKTTPQSYSNTYDALEKAYKLEPKTIILFTDGAPNRDEKSGIDTGEMDRIIDNLIKEHRDVPVNIIGLGNYFDKDIGKYFRKVTSLTGGTFIGR